MYTDPMAFDHILTLNLLLISYAFLVFCLRQYKISPTSSQELLVPARSCMEKFHRPPTPPLSCCAPSIETIADNPMCLCGLIKLSHNSKPQERITLDNALKLFEACGVEPDMSDCNASLGDSLVVKSKLRGIETIINQVLTSFPVDNGFAGDVDLGGLRVQQIKTFNRVWGLYEGGPTSIHEGYHRLGYYGQPNNKPLYGWVLVGKADHGNGVNEVVKQPVDYTLVWSSDSLNIKQDSHGVFWLPKAPNGYTVAGLVVSNSSQKPSPDMIRGVRSDFRDHAQTESWIWGQGRNGISIYHMKPSKIETNAAGTFILQNVEGDISSIACLKNLKVETTPMPNEKQLEAKLMAC